MNRKKRRRTIRSKLSSFEHSNIITLRKIHHFLGWSGMKIKCPCLGKMYLFMASCPESGGGGVIYSDPPTVLFLLISGPCRIMTVLTLQKRDGS